MVFKQCLCILALTMCHGQIVDLIFPSIAQTARELTNELTKKPIVRLTSQISGELIANSVNAITNLPIAIARSLGIGHPLPILINNSNVVDLADAIVFDFNAGLGNEDAALRMEKLVVKYGFPIEDYEVATEDGYILTLYRIPGNGSVVFLMHGLLGSADDYVIAGPNSGLAYLLAKDGYDVWMGNARGNKYCRRHTKMKPSEALFWDFSWHEIGYYDLPAMIDFILNKTGEQTLNYIGHSQGTTTFFVMASERPAYNRNVSIMIALSPVAFMTNVKSPVVRLLAPGGVIFHALSRTFGVYEFLPDDAVMRTLKRLMCGRGPLAEILCSNVMFIMTGFGFGQLNVTNLPVIYGHAPSGSAAKQFAHFGQAVLSRDFRKFDYGIAENLERYGTEIPPSYDLDKIDVPVVLFYSDADWLAHPKDVEELAINLGNATMYKVPYEQFNHVDFVWAKDFKILIYEKIRKLLT